MTSEEFTAYVESAIPEYALDKIASGQWSEDAALTLARAGYEELLPQGLATPKNFLLTVRASEAGPVVGMVWYAAQERAGQRIAYLYDLQVEPDHRRKGLGTAILQALEQRAGVAGLAGVELHVFGHNPRAQALYARLGYGTTNINMFKAVPSAGT